MTGEMDSLHLRRVLNEIAEDGVHTGVDLWPGVSAAVAKRRGMPRLRKAWAVPALAVLIVASVAAVTAGPRLVDEMGSLFSSNYRGNGDFGEPLELGLTQTLEGVTATLDSVQITELAGTDGVVQDGQIGVVWTLFGVDSQLSVGGITDGSAELQDSQGRVLPQMIGIGTDSTSEIFVDEVPPGARKNAYVFDLEGVKLEEDGLHLALEVPVLRITGTVPEQAAEPLTSEDGSVYGAIAEPAPQMEEVGTIRFEFTVPVEGGLSEPREDAGQSNGPLVLPPTPVAAPAAEK